MKLTVTNLGKQYRHNVWGVKDFSLEVKPGILAHEVHLDSVTSKEDF